MSIPDGLFRADHVSIPRTPRPVEYKGQEVSTKKEEEWGVMGGASRSMLYPTLCCPKLSDQAHKLDGHSMDTTG